MLGVLWIGLPLVLGALAACQALAEAHRRAGQPAAERPPGAAARPSSAAAATRCGGAAPTRWPTGAAGACWRWSGSTCRSALVLLARRAGADHAQRRAARARGERRSPGSATPSTSGRWRSTRPSGVLLIVLGARHARCSRSRSSAGCACALRAYTRRWIGAARAGGADPRAAGRARRRPDALDRLLAARPGDVRGRARAAGGAARGRAAGARGRRSSTTGAGWRRSSTTPSSTPRPSSSTRPRPRRRWRSTTSA